jgi:PBSX family phage terminase large subunit
MSGPAGTGKSRACLEKLHMLAELVPGCRLLILRRTRASLTETALVTYEQHVVPEGHPCLNGPQREGRSIYRYPNGSTIAVGGLDKPGKVMSSEWDAVYIQEAIELTEDGWEAVTTRLRNGKLPYQQLLADTNPDSPRHWLKKRCDAGKTRILESRHEDNPVLWDGQHWTPRGQTYLARLDALTGPRKLRLRHGRWVQAEGVVYEGWDPSVHLIDRFEVHSDWPRIWSIDFGFVNPFVCQFWAVDPDGGLVRYRELYHTRRLVEDHARRLLEIAAGEPLPVAIVCDHDAEDRATLERHLGLPTLAANKERSPGFQAVAARLARTNGRPRLLLMRDSLDERDRLLDEAKKPCCTEEEFDGYVWDTRGNRARGEEPVKADDHGLDALRYLVWTLDCGGTADPESRFERAL